MAQVRIMFSLHRQTRSLAKRFVFGILVAFVLALTCGLASHTAKAQVRIGIGVGGIGGVLLDDSYRRHQSQQSEQYQRSQSAAESKSTKKPPRPKIRNRRGTTQKSQKSR